MMRRLESRNEDSTKVSNGKDTDGERANTEEDATQVTGNQHYRRKAEGRDGAYFKFPALYSGLTTWSRQNAERTFLGASEPGFPMYRG